jgi:molybdate transport system substrate-binding protein
MAGCGEDSGGGGKPRLVVSAATSLEQAFEDYGAAFDDAEAKFSFAGSDVLAAQIRAGVKPDVYAAANTELPDGLFADGLVEKPVVFTHNRLVIAVPADSDAVDSVDDLARDGVELAIGSESVPIGAYTRKVIDALPARTSSAILANVRSEEPDVAGIVGKLTQGAADAGLVYVTDVKATGGRLTAVELPADLQPSVAYAIAIVKGSPHEDVARAFIDGLEDGPGRGALAGAGFEVGG